jgi:hypothetical protein
MNRLLIFSGNSSGSSADPLNSAYFLFRATFASDGVIFRDVGGFFVVDRCGNMSPVPLRYTSPNT